MFEVHSINTSLNRYTCSTYFNLFLVFTGKYLTPIQVYKNSSSSTTGKSPKHSDVVLDLTILTRNVEYFHFPIHSTEVSMLSHFLKKIQSSRWLSNLSINLTIHEIMRVNEKDAREERGQGACQLKICMSVWLCACMYSMLLRIENFNLTKFGILNA